VDPLLYKKKVENIGTDCLFVKPNMSLRKIFGFDTVVYCTCDVSGHKDQMLVAKLPEKSNTKIRDAPDIRPENPVFLYPVSDLILKIAGYLAKLKR
jgi:hypothetical protein